MDVVATVQAMGVVGAGGGGFPTHRKLSHPCEVVIANGAECEPLLGNDTFVMEREAADVVLGLSLAMEATGARKGFIALKAKHPRAETALRDAAQGKENIHVFLLGDYYPAGDEFLLVREVTGRIVPEGGIPLHVGVVVLNVETLRNIAQAARGRPVIERTLTCHGEVRRPSVLRVRIGTPFEEVFARCGGVTVDEYVIVVGGPMMGWVTTDAKAPVTKTTTGVFVLPRDHNLIRKRTLPLPYIIKQSKAACCQCTYCTELCPRYLLGHNLAPHKIMRQINLGLDVPPEVIEGAVLCSECGLCEVFACPMELSPRVVNHVIKERFLAMQYRPTFPKRKLEVRSDFPYRKVPVARIEGRLQIERYKKRPLTYLEDVLVPSRVELLLKQHAGVPARPVVRVGDVVQEGDVVGEISGEVSARVHASIAGRVVFVDEERVVIESRN
ncbi:4Fe-4S dicluster domain-containing protein [Candidatus Caldatribacterium sp.]|uniref:4Fe-4S dicluster domain-containing protein n=1 Tax=Candidatus Caldatribacterium sp. TaxID=2282143 RepID=UPI002998ACD7|nr:SLBB domain-containing protein [Candidatus Caldatribacterium sp.]MDW8080922.1 SLBB domain-containing protein [Candidatus Calescibacterium sp.]